MQADLVRSLDARLNVLLTDAEEAHEGENAYSKQFRHRHQPSSTQHRPLLVR